MLAVKDNAMLSQNVISRVFTFFCCLQFRRLPFSRCCFIRVQECIHNSKPAAGFVLPLHGFDIFLHPYIFTK